MNHKVSKKYPTKTMTAYLLASAASFTPLKVAAAPGDLLRTVTIPEAAQCTPGNGQATGFGTSVGLVRGGDVNQNQPILLVTSCYSSNTSTLYFLDPSTNPATLVGSFNTNNTPPLGWGALAYRVDKRDLIACGNNADGTHAVLRIDLSNRDVNDNATFPGNATFLFNGRPGGALCDGLAWDANDQTIYQSRPSQGGTLSHFRQSGVALTSLRFPANCLPSGLAAGGSNGGSLYGACSNNQTLLQLNKRTGSIDNSWVTNTPRMEDVECDTASFSATNQDAMWVRDANNNQLLAYEIPYKTCGLGGRAPEPPTQCPDGSQADNDGDGLLDCWETNGIDFNRDGTTDLVLEGANTNRKDIYLELDWMAQHQPHGRSVDMVIASFADAAVNNPATNDNPNGLQGINLHVETDEQALPHNNSLAFRGSTNPAPAGTPDFDEIKTARFGSAGQRAGNNYLQVLNAKHTVFHYGLFTHNLLGSNSSGSGEIRGDDFIVSHGGWAVVDGHDVGNTDQQAGTLMHELGHNLGLLHGGNDKDVNGNDKDVNCKPNYTSVMSYSYQNNGNFGNNFRPLDFSRLALRTLDENNLDERVGLGGIGDPIFYGPPEFMSTLDNVPVDWNRDGDTDDFGVVADINNLGGNNCDGKETLLVGFDDWENLRYNQGNTGNTADNSRLDANLPTEFTLDEFLQTSIDTDHDGFVDLTDNCPFTPNKYQKDSDGNGVGDKCQTNPKVALKNLINNVHSSGIHWKLRHELLGKLKAATYSQKKGDAVATIRDVQKFLQFVAANTEQKNTHHYTKAKNYGYKHANQKINYKLATKLITSARQIEINIEEAPEAHSGYHHRSY